MLLRVVWIQIWTHLKIILYKCERYDYFHRSSFPDFSWFFYSLKINLNKNKNKCILSVKFLYFTGFFFIVKVEIEKFHFLSENDNLIKSFKNDMCKRYFQMNIRNFWHIREINFTEKNSVKIAILLRNI